MQNIGDRIRYATQYKNISFAELSRRTSISKASLSQYANGKVNPKQDSLYKISQALDIDILWLLGLSDDIEKDKTTLNVLSGNNVINSIITTTKQLTLPRQQNVLKYANTQLDEQNTTLSENTTDYKVNSLEDYKLTKIEVTEAVAAGRGYSYGEDKKTYCYTDEELPRYDIASYIVGDSMEPHYKDGDVVLISREMYNGSGVYVVDYDSKSFLKEVHQENNGFRLVSFNKKYDDIFIKIPLEDDFIYFNIVGKVVGSFTPIER